MAVGTIRFQYHFILLNLFGLQKNVIMEKFFSKTS